MMATSFSGVGILIPKISATTRGGANGKFSLARCGRSANAHRASLGGRCYGLCKISHFISFTPESRRKKRIGRQGARASSEQDEAQQPSLATLSSSLQDCYFELCIKNLGRPAGAALHEFISTAVKAYTAGYTRDKLAVQITYGDHSTKGAEGWRLTDSERQYQSQWLDIIYVTLQLLKVVDNEASRAPATSDQHLFNTVFTTVNLVKADTREGIGAKSPPSSGKLDRGLATMGASGGVVAQPKAISPAWFPVTQLVLLTLKVVDDTA